MSGLGIGVAVLLRAVVQVLFFFQHRPSTPHYTQFSGAYFKVRRWTLNVPLPLPHAIRSTDCLSINTRIKQRQHLFKYAG